LPIRFLETASMSKSLKSSTVRFHVYSLLTGLIFFTVLCVTTSVSCYYVTTKVGSANIATRAAIVKVGSDDMTDMAGNSTFT
jgi:hypothetical protein